jgi:hypothetical protein
MTEGFIDDSSSGSFSVMIPISFTICYFLAGLLDYWNISYALCLLALLALLLKTGVYWFLELWDDIGLLVTLVTFLAA